MCEVLDCSFCFDVLKAFWCCKPPPPPSFWERASIFVTRLTHPCPGCPRERLYPCLSTATGFWCCDTSAPRSWWQWMLDAEWRGLLPADDSASRAAFASGTGFGCSGAACLLLGLLLGLFLFRRMDALSFWCELQLGLFFLGAGVLPGLLLSGVHPLGFGAQLPLGARLGLAAWLLFLTFYVAAVLADWQEHFARRSSRHSLRSPSYASPNPDLDLLP